MIRNTKYKVEIPPHYAEVIKGVVGILYWKDASIQGVGDIKDLKDEQKIKLFCASAIKASLRTMIEELEPADAYDTCETYGIWDLWPNNGEDFKILLLSDTRTE